MLFIFGTCLSHASASKFPSCRWAPPKFNTSPPSLVCCIENFGKHRTLFFKISSLELSKRAPPRYEGNIPKVKGELEFFELPNYALRRSLITLIPQSTSTLSFILLFPLRFIAIYFMIGGYDICSWVHLWLPLAARSSHDNVWEVAWFKTNNKKWLGTQCVSNLFPTVLYVTWWSRYIIFQRHGSLMPRLYINDKSMLNSWIDIVDQHEGLETCDNHVLSIFGLMHEF